MSTERPGFIDSPFFVGDPGNWHMKPGAPESTVREFNRYMEQLEPKPIETPTIDWSEV